MPPAMFASLYKWMFGSESFAPLLQKKNARWILHSNNSLVMTRRNLTKRRAEHDPYCEMRMAMETLFRTTLATLLIQLAAVAPVWAALGQTGASVERDRAAMGVQGHSRPGKGYSIETFTVAGMTIKEYVSSDGIVFAVAWRGTGAPDLSLLLGSYFEEYRDGLTALQNRKPRIRRPMVLKTAHLVVERVGHARSMWGRAFIPDLLPATISPEDIQ